MSNLFKLKEVFAFLFILTLVTSCQQENLDLNVAQEKYEELDKLFSAYTVVKIDKDKLLEHSQKMHNERFEFDLQIKEKPNWVFNVDFHEFFKEDYKAFVSDANGNWVEAPRTDMLTTD